MMLRSETSLMIILMLLLMPVRVLANTGLTVDVSKADTLKTEKNPGGQIITGPVADPSVYFDPYGDVFRVQSGLYAGVRHIGVESTYFSPGSSTFVDLFLGVANFRDLGSPSSAVWMSGVSAGRDYLLSNRERFMEEGSTDLYFRIGPGVGMAGRGFFFNRRETEYSLGLHTKVLIGAQYNFSVNTSIYVHGGGRVLWFPALEEIRFTGVPLISLGFQFSTSPQVPMVRF